MPVIDRMEIDDVNRLTRFLKDKTISSDHNNLFLYLNAKIPPSNKRLEILNLKNSESINLFKKETKGLSKLTECFIKPNKLEQQVNVWKKKLDDTIKRCFKKIL